MEAKISVLRGFRGLFHHTFPGATRVWVEGSQRGQRDGRRRTSALRHSIRSLWTLRWDVDPTPRVMGVGEDRWRVSVSSLDPFLLPVWRVTNYCFRPIIVRFGRVVLLDWKGFMTSVVNSSQPRVVTEFCVSFVYVQLWSSVFLVRVRPGPSQTVVPGDWSGRPTDTRGTSRSKGCEISGFFRTVTQVLFWRRVGLLYSLETKTYIEFTWLSP